MMIKLHRIISLYVMLISACVSSSTAAVASMAQSEVLRTPNERFENLPEYDFAPNFTDVPWGGATVRMHYVDEGPRDGDVIVLLHGQPSWSFLYRNLISALAARGYRVIAPDLIGYGRSDKPARMEDYTYTRHRAAVEAFIVGLGETRITLAVHDWGGLIGLPILADNPRIFSRLVAFNTSINDGTDIETPRFKAGFDRWIELLRTVPLVEVDKVIGAQVSQPLDAEIARGFMAPYPSGEFQSGVRQMSALIPRTPVDPGASENAQVRKALGKLEIPVLVAFSEDADRLHPGQFDLFRTLFAQEHIWRAVKISGTKHFLFEDRPDAISALVLDFLAANPLDAAPRAAEDQRAKGSTSLSQLMNDYSRFGPHRTGGVGSKAMQDALAERLTKAGFTVSYQQVPLLHQQPRKILIEAAGTKIADAFALWPLTFTGPDGLQGRLARIDQARAGDVALVTVPYERNASIYSPAARPLRQAIAASDAAALILITEHPSGEVVALNVRVNEKGESLDGLPKKPMLLVGAKHGKALEAMLGDPVRVVLDGEERVTSATNLIASTGPADQPSVVISTPLNGWFIAAAERGPGIAAAVLLGEQLAAARPDLPVRLVFTSHHELGGAGMKLAQAAPGLDPASTRLWLHLGANLSAREIAFGAKGESEVGAAIAERGLAASRELLDAIGAALPTRLELSIVALDSPSAVGEIVLVRRAGYQRAVGLVGYQPLHHTMLDDGRNLAPDDLNMLVDGLFAFLKDL